MKKILIPIDGSNDSLEGIRLFKDLNIYAHNDIYILNVQSITVPYEDYFSIGDKQGLMNYLEEQGEKALAGAKELLAGEKFKAEVKIGDPVTEILNYADEIDADMLVVGSHGRSGLTAVLMGSVTSKLLAYSTIPVLVTRPQKKSKEKFAETKTNIDVD